MALTIQLISQYARACEHDVKVLKEIGVVCSFRLHTQALRLWLWVHGDKLYELFGHDTRVFSSKGGLEKALDGWSSMLHRAWIVQNLEIGTVERFQGREKDLIISNTVYHPSVRTGRIHPAFADFRRLNVLVTRARREHIAVSWHPEGQDWRELGKWYKEFLTRSARLPREGYFNHVTKVPPFDFDLMISGSREGYRGSVMRAIESASGGKISIGDHGAMVVDMDREQGRDAEMEFLDVSTGCVRKIGEAVAHANGIVSESGRALCVDVCSYVCNGVHRKFLVRLQEDPLQLHGMVKATQAKIEDVHFKDLLLRETRSARADRAFPMELARRLDEYIEGVQTS